MSDRQQCAPTATSMGWARPIRFSATSIRCVVWPLLVACAPALCRAADDGNAPQWNIMVVPANPTVFSGEARTIFNKQCASCHSQDGRAQTPQALKDGVQDLSECTLTDDEIVQQILHGSRNKPVAYKMRPFREKLTQEQVESLVPLVKAFRPVVSAEQDSEVALPRLAGMLNSRLGNFAVLESPAGSGRYFFLRENERHADVKLIKLKPGKGLAKLEFVESKSNVILRLEKPMDDPPGPTGVFGFVGRLSQSLQEVPRSLVLEGVSTDLMLFLYSQFTERTVLRAPGLPAASFDLKAGASHRGDLAFRMKLALQANGIATIKYGDKFLLVVPESEASRISSQLPDSCSSVRDARGPDLFPGGVMVNFDNAVLAEVLALYAQVAGRALSPDLDPQGFDVAVDFTTQTPLTREDCAHALETILHLHDLKIVPVGSDVFTLEPVSDPTPYPR